MQTYLNSEIISQRHIISLSLECTTVLAPLRNSPLGSLHMSSLVNNKVYESSNFLLHQIHGTSFYTYSDIWALHVQLLQHHDFTLRHFYVGINSCKIAWISCIWSQNIKQFTSLKTITITFLILIVIDTTFANNLTSILNK